ncbi:UNVERIFIED_CONTAM: hypothetical protein GTU68_028127 [Idotea baltica]|nr:hypothetical protein [Idotea baltica]
MNERLTFQNQIEHRNLKYTGTGNPDTTKWEYGNNLRRDALSSHLSHFSRLLYFSAIENESTTRTKNRIYEEMVQPCGPPPPLKKKG